MCTCRPSQQLHVKMTKNLLQQNFIMLLQTHYKLSTKFLRAHFGLPHTIGIYYYYAQIMLIVVGASKIFNFTANFLLDCSATSSFPRLSRDQQIHVGTKKNLTGTAAFTCPVTFFSCIMNFTINAQNHYCRHSFIINSSNKLDINNNSVATANEQV